MTSSCWSAKPLSLLTRMTGQRRTFCSSEVGIRSRACAQCCDPRLAASLPYPAGCEASSTRAAPSHRKRKVGSPSSAATVPTAAVGEPVERLQAKPASLMEALWLGNALARLERFAEAIVPLERARTARRSSRPKPATGLPSAMPEPRKRARSTIRKQSARVRSSIW